MVHDADIDRQAALGRPVDVRVVGAGPAGITLARAVAAAGLDVVPRRRLTITRSFRSAPLS